MDDQDDSIIIRNVLRDIIIPSIQESGVSRVVLGKQHFTADDLPPTMGLTRRELLGQPTRHRGHISRPAAHWPDQGMERYRFPFLIFVYQGEADLLVGDAILHCPAGHAVLVPAGVASGEGDTHWCRPNPEQATSDILWLHLRPASTELFTCSTRGLVHDSGWSKRLTSSNPQLFPLLESFITEMEQGKSFGATAAAAYLSLLFCLLQRHWDSEDTPVAQTSPQKSGARQVDDSAVVIRRAKQYIDANLRETLSLETIAYAAYVSRSHLAQVFRSQTQQTVWEYVSQQRLERAKTLLAETDLPMGEVTRLSGLSRSSHFFARFTKLTGVTPGEYRRMVRNKNSATIDD